MTFAAHGRHRAPRLYRRIYLHGLALLMLVAVGLAAAAWILEPSVPSARWAKVLAATLVDRPEGEALAAEVRRLGGEVPVALALYSDDGRLLGASQDDPPPPMEAADVMRLRQGSESVRSHRLVAVSAGDGRYLAMALQAQDKSHLKHFHHLLGTLVLIVVVLALGSWPLARTIARPLERLSEAARRLGEGELSARSNVRTGDEIGELGAAFDEMAGRLQGLVEGQRELLASVSHELRTPLSRLRVTLGLAAEADPVRARSYLPEMELDLAELERLVEDLLATARLEAGDHGALRPDRLEVAVLLTEASRRFSRAHGDRQLEVEAAPGLPLVEADPSLFGRALDNLLSNAAKYSEPPSRVALVARPAEGGVTVEVRDRGIGIEAADLPRLFTPFFRTDRSRSRGTGGVGLGLALTRRVVLAHGGTIAVESSPGEGTTVRLWLPAAPE